MQKTGAIFKSLILWTFAINLLGCGNEKKDENQFEILETEAFADPQQLSQILNRWKVQCANPSDCPNSVGQILITDGKVLGLCTGTLVNSQYVLTNSHCFNIRDSATNSLISPDKICQAGTRIVFASNSSQGASQLFCHRVLKKSVLNGSESKADYLIFEVRNNQGRLSDSISRNGLNSDDKLTIRKVSPVRRGLGNLTTSSCRVIHSTLLAPRSNNPKQDVHVMSGCDSVQGNSGSSLIDSQGYVRAILFKGFVESFQSNLTSFQSEVRNKALKLKAVLVTNLSCLDFLFPNEDENVRQGCTSQHQILGSIYETLNQAEVQREFYKQQAFLSRDIETSISFGQNLKFVEAERTFYFSPMCLKRNVINPSTQFLNLFVMTPVFVPQIGVRDNLTTFVRGFVKDTRPCSITLSPREFFRSGRGTVRLAGSGCVNSQGIVSPESVDTWSLCPPP
ncbi:MAG: trypsin-like serine peptidase [Bdellovibrionales bacterium]